MSSAEALRDEEGIEEEEEENDLVDTITGLVTGCESFVTSAIIGIKKETAEQGARTTAEIEVKLQERDNEIEELKRRVSSMEESIKRKDQEMERMMIQNQCRCRELFNNFVTVGNMVFSGGSLVVYNQDGSQPTDINMSVGTDSGEIPTESTTSNSVVVEESTMNRIPCSSTPITAASEYQPRVVVEPMLEAYTDVMRQKQITSAAAETLNDLSVPLREEVQKYYGTKSPAVTNEYLTDLQRAYVKYIMTKPENKGLSPANMARTCIASGIKDNIWTADFRPPGVTDFYKYLHQRMRNVNATRTRAKLSSLQKSQSERLSDMVNPKKARLG